MCVYVCVCVFVLSWPMGSWLCAALNSRLNCFRLKIYLTLQTTLSLSLCPCCRASMAVARYRVLSALSKHDTHNCSIISHKVKNCCSILGVIQSSLRPGTTNVIIVSNCPLKLHHHPHTHTHTLLLLSLSHSLCPSLSLSFSLIPWQRIILFMGPGLMWL